MTKRSRADLVGEVEKLGVVAIIRLQDPSACAASSMRSARGG